MIFGLKKIIYIQNSKCLSGKRANIFKHFQTKATVRDLRVKDSAMLRIQNPCIYTRCQETDWKAYVREK